MPYTATHRHAPVSPRKARRVAQLVVGKSVSDALVMLQFAPQRSAKLLWQVIRSAQANAEDQGVRDVDNLMVKKAFVDEGMRLKRWRPRSRGSAAPYVKRRSHIAVELDLRA